MGRDANEERIANQVLVSGTTYSRLLAMHDLEMHAAAMIGNPNCYADFYCEGEPGEPPFHEAFIPPGTELDLSDERLQKKLRQRMARLDRRLLDRQAAAGPKQEAHGENKGSVASFWPWPIPPLPYNDFFADSLPNGPWDMQFDDYVIGRPRPRSLAQDPDGRVRALGKLSVVQAYLRLRERSANDYKSDVEVGTSDK